MKNVDERFTEMKSKLLKVLSEQKYVCVTCDVWSSRACCCLGMTVHFLNNEYQHCSHVLAFRKLKGKQTYLELAIINNEVLDEFEIPKEKIAALIGLYDKGNCKPLAGVIIEPFHEQTDTG